MKRFLHIGLFVVLCAVGILLISCGNNKAESNNTNIHPTNTETIETTDSTETTGSTDTTDTTETIPSNVDNTFYKDYVVDDRKPLDSIKAYDLNELNSFFKQPVLHDGDDVPDLKFSEVNDRFPVEIVRSGDYSLYERASNYSVYRVKQGGYYYVFWDVPINTEMYPSDDEPVVYIAIYLSSDRSPDLFDSITPEVSSVEDIKNIDPYCEVHMLSSAIYVFCYLNRDTALTFRCQYDGGIVNKIIPLPRKKSGVFSVILPSDLP